MSIWNINNLKISPSGEITTARQIRLWKTAPAQFRVIEQGDYLAVLDGALYTLIKNKYAPVFAKYPEQVTITPATIYDTVKNLENTDYVELSIFRTIDPKTMETEDSTGHKVWTYFGGLFVSDSLKIDIEKIPGNELNFHPGFQYWG
jgi:hypothetical protein